MPELTPGSVVTWLRSLSRTTVFVVCSALLALVLTVMRLLDAPTWAQIVGAVFVLALALASEADKRRTARLEKERNEQAALEAAEEKERKWLREARSALRIWPAPEIADADPELLGITRARRISHSADDSTLTRYVPRDIDSKAAERLRSRGAVLLVGEPASGVTRTAYELALADPTRRKVLAPRPTDGLRIAVNELEVLSRLAPPTRLLLWLDNIADHSTDGLNRSLLDQCKEESPRLRVIATIRSPDYQSWSRTSTRARNILRRPGPGPKAPHAQGAERRRAVVPRHRLQPGHRRRVHRNRSTPYPSDRRKLHLPLRAARGRLLAESRPDRYRHWLVRMRHPSPTDQGHGCRPRRTASTHTRP